jgi:hypothetical protein
MHSKIAEEYWIREEKISASQESNIHWEAIKKTLKASSLARRTFITKHATCMCGVGKSMKKYGGNETQMPAQDAGNQKLRHMFGSARIHKPLIYGMSP